MKTVEIATEPIELYKILKLEGLAPTGGVAKLMIDDGAVTVNSVVETRRRRKIVSGDIIKLQGERLLVQLI
jgi:ribosome-associated protein